MTERFLEIVNLSISAGWLVLAVLVLRLVLKRAPKWVNVLLWGLVAVRLLCPFSMESALSLIPSAETFPEQVISGPSFDVQTGIAPVDERINEYLGDRYFEGVTVPANNQSLSRQLGPEELAKHYPGALLLLQMTEGELALKHTAD